MPDRTSFMDEWTVVLTDPRGEEYSHTLSIDSQIPLDILVQDLRNSWDTILRTMAFQAWRRSPEPESDDA